MTLTKEKDLETGFRYYFSPAPRPGNPVIIHLHGTGERSKTNLDLVLRYGPLKLLKDGKKIGFDATIVQPQLDSGDWNDSVKLHAFIWHIIKSAGSDHKRIYLMGVSLGGYGVWKYLGSKYGSELACAVLMSPGGSPGGKESVIAASQVPLWVSNAPNDTVTKLSTALAAVRKINSLAGRPQALITGYGLSGHSTYSAWGRFMEPNNFYLWDWMKLQRKL